MESRSSVDFLFGDFHLDPTVPCLYRVDKAGNAEVPVVDLSTNALKLLLLLVERKGQVVSHKDIFKRVWREEDVDAFRIHVLVHKLRRALGRASIATVRRGYWIALKVAELPRAADPEDEKAITALYGVSPERLQELIKAAVTDAVNPGTEGIDELSSRLKVTQDAAIEMLRVIGQADVPLERFTETLRAASEPDWADGVGHRFVKELFAGTVSDAVTASSTEPVRILHLPRAVYTLGALRFNSIAI